MKFTLVDLFRASCFISVLFAFTGCEATTLHSQVDDYGQAVSVVYSAAPNTSRQLGSVEVMVKSEGYIYSTNSRSYYPNPQQYELSPIAALRNQAGRQGATHLQMKGVRFEPRRSEGGFMQGNYTAAYTVYYVGSMLKVAEGWNPDPEKEKLARDQFNRLAVSAEKKQDDLAKQYVKEGEEGFARSVGEALQLAGKSANEAMQNWAANTNPDDLNDTGKAVHSLASRGNVPATSPPGNGQPRRHVEIEGAPELAPANPTKTGEFSIGGVWASDIGGDKDRNTQYFLFGAQGEGAVIVEQVLAVDRRVVVYYPISWSFESGGDELTYRFRNGAYARGADTQPTVDTSKEWVERVRWTSDSQSAFQINARTWRKLSASEWEQRTKGLDVRVPFAVDKNDFKVDGK